MKKTLNIGASTFQFGFKYKYKKLIRNVYVDSSDDDKMILPQGISLVFEEGPRSFGKNKIELKNLVWMTDSSWSTNVPLLVAAESLKVMSKPQQDFFLQGVIPEHTVEHEALSPALGGPMQGKYRQNFIIDKYNWQLYFFYKEMSSAIEQKFNFLGIKEQSEINNLAIANNWSKEQIKSYKREKNDLIKQEISEQKAVIESMKEIDMVSIVSIRLSKLIDEAKSLHDYMGDVNNRMNTSNYNSRAGKISQMIKILQKMRADT